MFNWATTCMHSSTTTFAAGCASGFIEVSLTHPLDVLKMNMQRGSTPNWQRCYAGVATRWTSVLPMRGILWSAKRHGSNMSGNILGKSTVLGSACGAAQSIIDVPMENIKFQKQLMQGGNSVSYAPGNLCRGVVPNVLRNMVLCSCILGGALSEASLGLPIGAAFGCILSQPLDYVKSMHQSNMADAINMRHCMRGWLPRAMMTPVNICVSYGVFHFIESNMS